MPSFEGPTWLEEDPNDLRLFLEDICCDLCRFQELARWGGDAEFIRIDREVWLKEASFADIRVQSPGQLPYFVEVKYGYPGAVMVRHLIRKYAGVIEASKVVLVCDIHVYPDWPEIEEQLRASLSIPLEVWDETRLIQELAAHFKVNIESVSASKLLDLRNEIDRAKGQLAFGGNRKSYHHDPLRAWLLWHFSFWRLRQLREKCGISAREVLRPGHYEGVVAVLADLCGFSSYVRDTADAKVVMHNLTSFYTKARYQITNRGGMLSQFVGDEVIAFFGIPDRKAGFREDALHTARALLDIGHAISHKWQRQIDRIQPTGGIHVGMAVGDLLIFPQRPFSRTHMAEVGDAINVAARLMNVAGPGEIVMSNTLHQKLGDKLFLPFEELAPVEAKNVGRVKAWRFSTQD